MDRDENDQSSSMLILPRLDRLDRLVCHLEEKSSSSESYFSGPIPTSQDDCEKQCKPLPAALEEVHSKGTLMERVAMLENRVLQLSLELEERGLSSSSMRSNGKKSPAKTISDVFDVTEDRNEQEIQDKCLEKAWNSESQNCKTRNKNVVTAMRHKKWLGWFQMGC